MTEYCLEMSGLLLSVQGPRFDIDVPSSGPIVLPGYSSTVQPSFHGTRKEVTGHSPRNDRVFMIQLRCLCGFFRR